MFVYHLTKIFKVINGKTKIPLSQSIFHFEEKNVVLSYKFVLLVTYEFKCKLLHQI